MTMFRPFWAASAALGLLAWAGEASASDLVRLGGDGGASVKTLQYEDDGEDDLELARIGRGGFRGGFRGAVGVRGVGFRGGVAFRGGVGFRGGVAFRGGFRGPWVGVRGPWVGARVGWGPRFVRPAPWFWNRRVVVVSRPWPVFYGTTTAFPPVYYDPCPPMPYAPATEYAPAYDYSQVPINGAVNGTVVRIGAQPALPLPQKAPPRLPPPDDGTYPYDGGPPASVPVPQDQPAPAKTPRPATPQAPGTLPVSVPAAQPARVNYPAYGDHRQPAPAPQRGTYLAGVTSPAR
jgi:hypothetical protein